MNIAEHSAALVSVIVGLGLAERLGDLHRVIRVGDKVRWYGLWVLREFFALLMAVNIWLGGLHLDAPGIASARSSF